LVLILLPGRRRKAQYNPVEINRKLNKAVKRLLKLNGEKRFDGNTPGQAPAASFRLDFVSGQPPLFG
jgi:hypothetical protein